MTFADNGAYFTGNSILVLNTAEIFEKVIINWNEIDEQTFSFAFSTTNASKSTKLTKPQALATIHFKHNKFVKRGAFTFLTSNYHLGGQ